jgi:hypothetical protein
LVSAFGARDREFPLPSRDDRHFVTEPQPTKLTPDECS